jgi:Kef-type K+ transport system membrane component KefB
MALLLEAENLARTAALIVLFAVVAVATGVLASKAHEPRFIELFRRMMNTSAQLPVRSAMLLLGGLVALSRGLGLDAVLGAITAGIVVSLAVHWDQREGLAAKLDGVGFGFFIPIFFIASGMRFDLAALLAAPVTILRVPLFLALFLVVRGLPALLLYRKELPWSERLALALCSSTQLPVVVAITIIGVQSGKMHPENAAALVGAGMLSVFLFPSLALAIRRRSSNGTEAATPSREPADR